VNEPQSPFPHDDEFLATVRLSLCSGIGPAKMTALSNYFGDLHSVLTAEASQLQQVAGIGPKLVKTILAARDIDIENELSHCRDFGIDILTRKHPDYPALLGEIPDPPNVLYVKGKFLPADELSIAIVGTRHATHYGLKQAERFGYELAKAGFTIVSGLARGVDAAAHRGAIRAKGRTIAFLGGGVSSVYPPEHLDLSKEVTEQGALVSEAAPLMKPIAGAFPQRNRLITGISLGVLVVEAATRSGALISARTAMEQNREVFALPGQLDNPVAAGCNRLIRDGAALVQSVDDIIDQLGPLRKPIRVSEEKVVIQPTELNLNQQESRILQHIETAPTAVDTIVEASQLPVHRVLATLSTLEMKRLIRRHSGNSVERIC